jgi:hypothetical protein
MKSLLKICLISVSLIACNSGADNNRSVGDSSRVVLPPDSIDVTDGSSDGPFNAPDPGDPERETKRQIILNLLSSKEEINQLRTEVSDSLAKSGLSSDRRSLFVSTMRQLETSADLTNKQLQEILISDLESSKGRLGDIIKRMRGSERELAGMIQRLDKITGYMQLAATLMQTLLPIPSTASPGKPTKENK